MAYRIFSAIIIAAVIGSAVAQHRPVLPNGFLTKRVHSVSQLVSHVKANDYVRDAYKRHFAMTDEELIAYFQTLQLTRLAKDETFMVYGMPESGQNKGELRAKSQKLKKGELVFSEPNGSPVLLADCGNPLLKPEHPVIAGKSEPTVTRLASNLKEMGARLESVTEGELVAIVPPDIPPILPVPVPPVVPPTVITTGGEGGGTVLPLAGLGILPALFLIGGSGGSSPVPEPGTLIAVGFGVSLLAIRRRRSR